MKKFNAFVILLMFIGAVVYTAVKFTPLIYKNSIKIGIVSPQSYYSSNKPIVIKIKDKFPLREVRVYIYSKRVSIPLFDKVFVSGSTTQFDVSFKPAKKLPSGKADLVVFVSDFSKNNFFGGFSRKIIRHITVYSKPPQVYLLSGVDSISVGGTGIAIFYVKDQIPLYKTYIEVTYGKHKEAMFRAYNASKIFSGKPVYLGFFTYPYSRIHNWNAYAVAEDVAGNVLKISIPVYYSVPRVKRPEINVDESFVVKKVNSILSHQGLNINGTPLDKFLYVMGKVFPENLRRIREICSESENTFLWSKYPFTQLFHSEVETGFYVMRRWSYNGRVVFRTPFYHPGYDLASVAHAMVNASNSGKVVFEGYIGVFGKTLIIDHGFGVFSLYSHLNNYLVPVGKYVKRNQYVATTDTTGLAFGDHLDFGILLSGWFVNPMDWWGPKWIRYHILDKIKKAKLRLSLLSNY